MPRLKDRSLKEKAKSAVYKTPCAECSAAYIGETKCFPERMRRHEDDERNFEREPRAVAEHCEVLDHPINFANEDVIDTEPDIR